MPHELHRGHRGPRASDGTHTSPPQSRLQRAVPAAVSPPSEPHDRECWESPAGVPHHSASGYTLVVPVRVDTSSSSALHAAPPAAAPAQPFQSPRKSPRPIPAPHRSPWCGRRRAPGCPVDAPCRRLRRRGSAVRSWLADTAPVAGPGFVLGFLVSPQSPSLSRRGRLFESGSFPPAALTAFRSTTAPSDSSIRRDASTAVLGVPLRVPLARTEVSRVRRVPVITCRPCYPGGALRCTD